MGIADQKNNKTQTNYAKSIYKVERLYATPAHPTGPNYMLNCFDYGFSTTKNGLENG